MGLETEVLRVAFSFFVSLPCMSLGYIKLRLSDCVFESIILELELWTEALCCLACLCRWNINVLHRLCVLQLQTYVFDLHLCVSSFDIFNKSLVDLYSCRITEAELL